MHNQWMDRVSDYVDGELDFAERELFEERMAEDPELRRAVEEVENLVARAAGLGPIEVRELKGRLGYAQHVVTFDALDFTGWGGLGEREGNADRRPTAHTGRAAARSSSAAAWTPR